jgi:protocatechuate 3,4-dioxygenase beta subunit
MSKINLSRRQFVNGTAASAGLFGMSGLSNLVLGEESEDPGVKKLLRVGDKGIPYIGITEDGPLYPPVEIPWIKDLTAVGGKGKRPNGETMYMFGRILDAKGRPIPSAVVEIWQADNNGNYNHPRGGHQKELDPNFGYFGKVKTADDGTYLFKTIMPKWYNMFGTKRASHVHLKMRHRQHGVLTTEMYFSGKEEDDIRENDHVFKSRFTPDRLIVDKETPDKYSSLDIEFEKDAVCCNYDLAFLL